MRALIGFALTGIIVMLATVSGPGSMEAGAPDVPRLALTTTPTPTATPVGGCDWTGDWDTLSAGERFAMTLTQSGAKVSGAYGGNRFVEGTLTGRNLTGRWAGPPAYAEPNNAGRFEFTIAENCTTFSGTWGFNTAISGGGVWTGQRTRTTVTTCSWTGDWDTQSGVENLAMTLVDQKGAVAGSYGGSRLLDGTASGLRISGTWAGPPAYAEPKNAGRFDFVASADCQSFSGTWGLASSTTGGGVWTGRRLRTIPGTCLWAGDWNTRSGVETFDMALLQSGSMVSGRYADTRTIEAQVTGYRLSGRWTGPPAFTEPDNAGRFEFILASDCRSFVGTWGLDTQSIGRGSWTGRWVSSREDSVRTAFLTALGREPSAEERRHWVGIALYGTLLESDLRNTAEGQRVAAVRALYLELLLRDPVNGDNAGLRYWVETPWDLATIRASMSEAPEVQRVLAIRNLYRELLGRGDDLTGIRYWASSPLTLEDLRTEFMNSEEYRRMHPGG